MSRDEKRGRSQRVVQLPRVAPGPLRDLKHLLYEAYLAADHPQLDEIVADIVEADAQDHRVTGTPSRDTIARCLRSPDLPAKQADATTIATVLARRAAWDEADLVARVRELWVKARMAQPIGRPVSDVDPFALGVHRAMEAASLDPGAQLPVLPVYVQRAHDEALRETVRQATDGSSQLKVLVGGSSTGKSRAAWEAISALPDGWRLWHPIAPGGPEAALTELAVMGPRTVIWLDEIQQFLLTPGSDMGERAAAGLHTLLHDPDRAPVLILGTIWPEDWDTLTTAPRPGAPNPHTKARALLSGQSITVPSTFTGIDLHELRASAHRDPRLAHAAEHAEQGQITQHLAGAPALLDRYHTAPEPARALIEAAMDARRLGHGLTLPYAMLQAAVEGYLTDQQWDLLQEDWLERALAYTTEPLRGARGPLTRIRPRTRDAATLQPQFRLADYLEEHARESRRYTVPPAEFWTAAAQYAASPGDLMVLANAAQDRWLLRHAALLYQAAADANEMSALIALGELYNSVGASGEALPLFRTAADAGDARAQIRLGQLRKEAGATDEALSFFQAAAQSVSTLPENSSLVLAMLLEEAGQPADAERVCLARVEAGTDDHFGWGLLSGMRMKVGDWHGAEPYARRAARLGDHSTMLNLADAWRKAGDETKATALYQELVDVSDTYTLLEIAFKQDRAEAERLNEIIDARVGDSPEGWDVQAMRLEEAGDLTKAEQLYRACADAQYPGALSSMTRMKEAAEDWDEAARYALRALAKDGDDFTVQDLARTFERAGDFSRAEGLYQACAEAGLSLGFWGLADLREQSGDRVGAERAIFQSTAAGHSLALSHFARRRRTNDPRWQHLLRYGLEPDGRIADPW
ncbi:tetratricopeptide repeat protein [Streptomyces sp. NPDC058773]|uniref:tetratricopeptide repeat protein n=1 Tax=Streptomyces sp. NPDC058773 TaxID=3346632 RepID=UPI0036AB6234